MEADNIEEKVVTNTKNRGILRTEYARTNEVKNEKFSGVNSLPAEIIKTNVPNKPKTTF